jgi:hypothetical protein
MKGEKAMKSKNERYYAVTYPDSDHPIYGIGTTPREAWESFLPDACTSLHTKDQMKLGMPDELREMDAEEWERLGIEDLVDMDVMRCSKALFDEVQKYDGDIAYAYDRHLCMLVTSDEMEAEEERMEMARRAKENRIFDEGLSAYEAGKPETSNPYHGGMEEILWEAGWTDGRRLHRAMSKTNDVEVQR